MQIYLTATLNSKPEFLEEVTSVLQHMVTESRKDPACIQYNLHQGIADKTLFVFQEIWESQDALDTHNEQPFIREFRKMVAEKLQGAPSVYLLHRV